MIKKFFKTNKGISIMDIGIAITLFAVFAGLVGNLYYQIAFNNLRVRYEGIATYNVVRLAEYVDEQPYTSIVSKTNNELKSMLDYPNVINITMVVSKYSDENIGAEDLVKTVNITASYQIMGKDYEFSIEKLKIKEK